MSELDSWTITGFEKKGAIFGEYYELGEGTSGALTKNMTGPGLVSLEGEGFGINGMFTLGGVRIEGDGGTYRIPEGNHDAKFDMDGPGRVNRLFYFEGYSIDAGLMNSSLYGGVVSPSIPAVSNYLNYRGRDLLFYEKGTVLEVEAVPSALNRFVDWHGEFSGSGEKLTITMDRDYRAAPIFELTDSVSEYVSGFRGSLPTVNSLSSSFSYSINEGDTEMRSILFSVEGPALLRVVVGVVSLDVEYVFFELDGVGKPIQFFSSDPVWLSEGAHLIEVGVDPSKIEFGDLLSGKNIKVGFPLVESFPARGSYLTWWKKFDSEYLDNADVLRPELDFDRDGLSNFAEYLLMRNPVIGDPYLSISHEPDARRINLSYYSDTSIVGDRLRLMKGWRNSSGAEIVWGRFGAPFRGVRDAEDPNLFHSSVIDYENRSGASEVFYRYELGIVTPALEEVLED